MLKSEQNPLHEQRHLLIKMSVSNNNRSLQLDTCDKNRPTLAVQHCPEGDGLKAEFANPVEAGNMIPLLLPDLLEYFDLIIPNYNFRIFPCTDIQLYILLVCIFGHYQNGENKVRT